MKKLIVLLILASTSAMADVEPSPSPSPILSPSPSPSASVNPLTVTTVDPMAAPIAGDTLLHVRGTGFTEDCSVRIGNVSCKDVRVISETELYCRNIFSSAGKYDVTLKCGANEATLEGGFTYFDPLRVSSAPKAVLLKTPFNVGASGGVPPYQYSISYGQCQMDGASGAGLCTYVDYAQVTVIVKDAVGNTATADIPIVWPLLSSAKLGYIGENSEELVSESLGGLSPYQFSIALGDAQLVTHADGSTYLRSGKTPGAVSVSVTDSLGEKGTEEFTVVDAGYIDQTFAHDYVDVRHWTGDSYMPILATFQGKALLGIDLSGQGAAVLRVNPNGSPDPTFGDGGYAVDPLPEKSTGLALNAMEVLEDGSTILGERRDYYTWWSDLWDYDLGEARITKMLPNGKLDPNFGEKNGATRFSYNNITEVLALARRTDGSLWTAIGACSGQWTHCRIYVTLIDSSGKRIKFDGTRGEAKIRLTDQAYNSGSTAQLLSDGKNGFFAYFTAQSGLMLKHYDAEGKSDDYFDASEVKKVLAPHSGCLAGEMARTNERIFIGWVCRKDDWHLAYHGLMLHAADGSVDTGFAEQGYLNPTERTLWTTNGGWAKFQEDGKLLISLDRYRADSDEDAAPGMIRLLPDGELDKSFGAQGHLLISPSYYQDGPIALDGEHGFYQMWRAGYLGKFVR